MRKYYTIKASHQDGVRRPPIKVHSYSLVDARITDKDRVVIWHIPPHGSSVDDSPNSMGVDEPRPQPGPTAVVQTGPLQNYAAQGRASTKREPVDEPKQRPGLKRQRIAGAAAAALALAVVLSWVVYLGSSIGSSGGSGDHGTQCGTITVDGHQRQNGKFTDGGVPRCCTGCSPPSGEFELRPCTPSADRICARWATPGPGRTPVQAPAAAAEPAWWAEVWGDRPDGTIHAFGPVGGALHVRSHRRPARPLSLVFQIRQQIE